MQYPTFNLQYLVKGGEYVSDTSLHAGPYVGCFAHSATVIASVTCATLTGTLTTIAIPAGVFYPFPGAATALTLASGQVTLVKG